MPDRNDALALLHDWVENEGLRKHMYAVEAAVRHYARKMGADEEIWGLAGLLHDIGKLGVPVSVLDKPGKLTAEEYRMVQRHSELGASILQPINAYADIISMVRHHHENFDGSSYPDGLAGNDI